MKSKPKAISKIKQSEIKEILKELEKQKKKAVPAKSKKVAKKAGKEKLKKIAKNIENKAHIDYQKANFYQQNSLDYSKLFSHMGNPYKKPYESYTSIEKQEANPTLTYSEAEKIIKKEQINLMLRNSLDRLTIEDKEKYNYWKEFNKMWNMFMIDMQKVGNAMPGVFYV
ncbi:hypothetical protein KY332_05330 [Candidatus Woesearchaeota archaeon]|nr:hypothetical protein [Candidatus Woesearchaeota archaeon]